MDAQSILYIALAVSVVVLVAVLSIALLSIRRSVDRIAVRLDESLRQVEMTAEDVRRTMASMRDILNEVERGVSNVTHFTEGIRDLRGTVDVASKVFHHAVSPALVSAASALAGFKAATSTILERLVRRKEETK